VKRFDKLTIATHGTGRKSFVVFFNLSARPLAAVRQNAHPSRLPCPLYAGTVQRTTVEGVRIAWARTARDERRATGRALIRALGSQLAPGTDLRIEQRCTLCGGPHGRPLLPDAPLLASVAYADPWVAVAVARHHEWAAIGLDLEVEVEGTALDLRSLFAPEAPPDLRGWTAIEAVLKADGRGLLLAPDQVRLSPDGRATVPDGGEFRILPVSAEPGMVVTLAVRQRLRG